MQCQASTYNSNSINQLQTQHLTKNTYQKDLNYPNSAIIAICSCEKCGNSANIKHCS